MRSRFRSRAKVQSHLKDMKSKSGVSAQAKLNPDDIQKLFNFARARYGNEPETQQQPISYSFQTGKRPDQLSSKLIKQELDAAAFAIKEMREFAQSARDTFMEKKALAKRGDAAIYTRSKLDNDEIGQTEAIAESDGPDTQTTDARRRRRVRGLFRRR